MPPKGDGKTIVIWDPDGKNRLTFPTVKTALDAGYQFNKNLRTNRPHRCLVCGANPFWVQYEEDEQLTNQLPWNDYGVKIGRTMQTNNLIAEEIAKTTTPTQVVFNSIQEFFRYPGSRFVKLRHYQRAFCDWLYNNPVGSKAFFFEQNMEFEIIEKKEFPKTLSMFVARTDLRDEEAGEMTFHSLTKACNTGRKVNANERKTLHYRLSCLDVYHSHDGYMFRICQKTLKKLGIHDDRKTVAKIDNRAASSLLEDDAGESTDEETDAKVDAVVDAIKQENPWYNPTNFPKLDDEKKKFVRMAAGRKAIHIETSDRQAKALIVHWFHRVLGVPLDYIEVFFKPQNHHRDGILEGDVHVHHPNGTMIRFEVKIATSSFQRELAIFPYELKHNRGKYDWLVVFGVATRPGLPGEDDLEHYLKSSMIDPKFRLPQSMNFSRDWEEAPNALDPEIQKRMAVFVQHSSESEGGRYFPCFPRVDIGTWTQFAGHVYPFNDPSLVLHNNGFGGFFVGAPFYEKQKRLEVQDVAGQIMDADLPNEHAQKKRRFASTDNISIGSSQYSSENEF